MNAIQRKMQKDVMKLNQEDLVVLTITTFAPQLFIFKSPSIYEWWDMDNFKFTFSAYSVFLPNYFLWT